MDKPFNHLIICLTFVMPVAALSGCSGPNDSPEQDAVMSISSCTARGDDGQEMSVSEFGMFVTDTAGNLYPDNIRVLNRSGKWTFAEISLSDGDKGIYAYYPYNPSFSGGKMAWTQGARQTICIRKEPWCPGTHPPPPSPCIIFFRR